MSSGKLYIVATPIGNLEDITFRALSTLKQVDVILCEDTRVTKILLDHYQIAKPLVSYHHHSDARKIKEIQAMLHDGQNLALVTDAGTPGISDPGNELIHTLVKCHAELDSASNHKILNQVQDDKVTIVPIPGPSAMVAALSVSGFPTDKCTFLGFPPHKNKRQKFFTTVSEIEHAVVFFESGHRIAKCLKELAAVLEPNRQILVCRELTKKFETLYRGTAAELSQAALDERGEFVVVVNSK